MAKSELEKIAGKIERQLSKPLGVLPGGSWGKLGWVCPEAVVLVEFNLYGNQEIEKILAPYGYSYSGYNMFERVIVFVKKQEN